MLLSLGTATIAIVLVVLLPGPDTLVVMRNLVRGGRSLGTRTAAGNLCGLAIWVCLTSLGVTAVLRASEIGYDVLRVGGAVYLVWLGLALWRSRAGTGPDPGTRRGLLGSGFTAGILTNLLNPKVGVFFIAFLPQFVPAGWSTGTAMLVLGVEFILVTAAYWALLIGLASRLSGWMASARIRRRMDRLTGTILIGFGIRLATER